MNCIPIDVWIVSSISDYPLAFLSMPISKESCIKVIFSVIWKLSFSLAIIFFIRICSLKYKKKKNKNDGFLLSSLRVVVMEPVGISFSTWRWQIRHAEIVSFSFPFSRRAIHLSRLYSVLPLSNTPTVMTDI